MTGLPATEAGAGFPAAVAGLPATEAEAGFPAAVAGLPAADAPAWPDCFGIRLVLILPVAGRLPDVRLPVRLAECKVRPVLPADMLPDAPADMLPVPPADMPLAEPAEPVAAFPAGVLEPDPLSKLPAGRWTALL